MTTTETLTFTNIVLTAITLSITFANYKHIREKDFQENLYKIKIEAYKTLLENCLDVLRKLDINSTPFVEIYNFKTNQEWEIYYEKEVGKLLVLGFDIQKMVLKESLFLPSDVINQLIQFSHKAVRYVVLARNFDTGLIIDRQDELHELYFTVVNSFRNDLGIEIIDESLKNRISEIQS